MTDFLAALSGCLWLVSGKQRMPPIEKSLPETPAARPAKLNWWVWLLPLALLWGQLLVNLWPEWNTNPQYNYGMVVPLLAAGLLLRRWGRMSAAEQRLAFDGSRWLDGLAVFAIFLFLPIRLVAAATPEWRPLQWVFGLVTVGLTLYAIYLAGGRGWLRQAAFPVLFFLVAIPWPSPVEQPIIQGLSRMNATLVVEVLGMLGIPAIQHGNVIQISEGMVGINDACSGIRSLQSCLMVSLFWGEFYRFRWPRRLVLVAIGFVLAMGFNLGRATLLTWIAARKGLQAIATYHDEAGFTIMLACTAGLWLAAWGLNWRKPAVVPAPAAAPVASVPPEKTVRRLRRFALALLVWLVAVNVAVELWYRTREARLHPGPNWTVNLPVDDPSFRELPLTPEEHLLLQFDDGQKGQWETPDGTVWQAFYFNWKPGRVAGYLAKRHTPEICLTAVGLTMTAGPVLDVITVHGVDLPMRGYTFEGPGGVRLQVFQCHWESGLGRETFTASEASRFNLIRGIWAGRGNQGQKVLELVASGYPDLDSARQALTKKLDSLIVVQDAAPAP